MRRRYRLARDARTDLLKIWNYLAENESFSIADKVLADIYAAMDKVAATPSLGHLLDDVTPLPVKFYRVHQYLIVYTPIKTAGISRIIHGARDLRAMFTQD